MNSEENLIKAFKAIAKKRWIKSDSSSHGSIGIVFEKELCKSPDAFYFPDYEGIEIKCSSRYSRYPLYLFTVSFDGPTFPEINRIVDNYGAPDKDFIDKKVLFTKLNAEKINKSNSKYKFGIELDRKEEKMYLLVYDESNNLIERKSFVYLDSIKNHLLIKLNKLAVIYASKKKENKFDFFRYYKITIYELLSFELLLDLIENRTISIELISRISKSGEDIGRYRNKNLVFSINKKQIFRLFKKIYEYNADTKEVYGRYRITSK